ncbi:MAG UNVERIFIED_CONTAM: hypothetical protein LVR29_33010 [Microcystis novacekii LVE1205-3]|jgi:hypothetical protein
MEENGITEALAYDKHFAQAGLHRSDAELSGLSSEVTPDFSREFRLKNPNLVDLQK